jgi:hypothetical protein
MSSDLIGGYLTFYLNQPIKWADFRLDALLIDRMLGKLKNLLIAKDLMTLLGIIVGTLWKLRVKKSCLKI